MFDRKKRKKGRRGDAVVDGAEGLGEAAAGAWGCDINFLIGLTLITGLPLLMWSL